MKVPSPKTLALYDELVKLPVGATMKYKALSRIAGVDVQRSGRGYLASAINMALREKKVLKAVRGKGIRRLTDREIVALGMSGVETVRRAAVRMSRRLDDTLGDEAALPAADQADLVAARALIKTAGSITRPANVKEFTAMVADNGYVDVSVKRTLDFFRRSKASTTSVPARSSVTAVAS